MRCPDCDAKMIPGPRGGAAQNFYCSNREHCRQGFNFTIFRGRVVHFHRIGEVDDQRYRMYAHAEIKNSPEGRH